jgi:hypothetical protein
MKDANLMFYEIMCSNVCHAHTPYFRNVPSKASADEKSPYSV